MMNAGLGDGLGDGEDLGSATETDLGSAKATDWVKAGLGDGDGLGLGDGDGRLVKATDSAMAMDLVMASHTG